MKNDGDLYSTGILRAKYNSCSLFEANEYSQKFKEGYKMKQILFGGEGGSDTSCILELSLIFYDLDILYCKLMCIRAVPENVTRQVGRWNTFCFCFLYRWVFKF